MVAAWQMTFSQVVITEQQVIDSILIKNYAVTNALLKIESQKSLQKTAWNISDPEVYVEQAPFESLILTIDQNFDFPTQYIKQSQLNREKITLTGKEFSQTKNEIRKNIRLLYLQAQYVSSKLNYIQKQDSAFQKIKDASVLSFNAGNLNYLEKISAEAKSGDVKLQFESVKNELLMLNQQISLLTGIENNFVVAKIDKLATPNVSIDILSNPAYVVAQQNINVSQKQYEAIRSQALPNILLGYSMPLKEEAVYVPAFKAGISIPLWFNSYSGYNSAAKNEIIMAENNLRTEEQSLQQQKFTAISNFFKNELAIRYYETQGLNNANEITKAATRLYESGEIDLINFLRTMNDGFEIQLSYLEALLNYNISVIEIDYLNGN